MRCLMKFVIVFCCFSTILIAGEFSLKGQADVSGLLGNPQIRLLQLRYIPTAEILLPAFGPINTDLEFAANLFARADRQLQGPDADGEFYRGWIRFSTHQFEVRLGRQKINFGPALLLRGLRWFDRLDPRDPLQITDGVDAALLRYFWLNNANLWLWGLWPNDQSKGYEVLPTRKNQPEWGGRFQYPIFFGEIAVTGHYRQAAIPEVVQLLMMREAFDEARFALDGKWDPLMGLWFEAVLVKRDLQLPPLPSFISNQFFNETIFLTLGTDYTFPIWDGLRVTVEQLLVRNFNNEVVRAASADLTALYLNLPLGLLDAVTAVIYADWQNENFTQFIGWNRVYDHWSFNLNLFWNSENNAGFSVNNTNGAFDMLEKGIQLQAVFNH